MMRRLMAGLFVIGLALAALSALSAAGQPPAGPDDPPLLKKKKDKPAPPMADPEKPEARPPLKRPKLEADDDQPPAAQPAEAATDLNELLQRVVKNSRKAEDRIANKQVDEPTRQLQRDVLTDIDALIKVAEQQAQNNQQAQSQPSRPNRPGRGQATARAPGQGQGQPQQPGQGQGNQPGMGGGGQGEVARLAEVYKDIWGHLPEAMRAEMNAYSREQFMDKYREQLKRYYSSIAEKGRKGD